VHCQILSSGSEGNSALVRAGDVTLLVDAGLAVREQRARMQAAGLGRHAVDHVLVTHGHLDHARSSGAVARREEATLHCAERIMKNRAVRRAPRLSAITIGRTLELRPRGRDAGSAEPVRVLPVLLPHDCDPTVAFRMEHAGRVAVVITDIGHPDEHVARALAGAHLLVLEFNHELGLMAESPYPPALQRRITGRQGHLSNEEAARMLERLAGPELHTLVLAHLSQRTNRPELALAAAHATLERLGLAHVRVLVARQDEVGESLAV
jgi:phosphoribosyl 1,2-cyclic phosphodiesterase